MFDCDGPISYTRFRIIVLYLRDCEIVLSLHTRYALVLVIKYQIYNIFINLQSYMTIRWVFPYLHNIYGICLFSLCFMKTASQFDALK